MERRFLVRKGVDGRGIKEKNSIASCAMEKYEAVKDGVAPSVTVARRNTIGTQGTNSVMVGHDNLHDVNAVDETVTKERQSPLMDTTGFGSYPPLPTYGTTPAGNTPGNRSELLAKGGFFLGKRVAYPVVANYARNTWGKFGLVKSMLNSSTGLFSFQFSSMDGLNLMLENGPWFVRNHPLILRKWNKSVDLLKKDVGNVPVWVKLHGVPVTGMSSYTRVMIELRADVELKDTIVVAMPKIIGEGYYTCIVRVEYEWKPLSVPVGPKVGFKPHKEYRPVPKKPTASSSELGTNGGTTNLVNNGANSSGSSFMNVDNSSTSTTPVNDKIGKFEDLLIDGQAILVDEAGNPLKKIEYPSDYDSEDEVASVDNDMAHSMASERVGFGTQSLLEQWRDSYGNGDYDKDPYDDDMYEGQDLPQEIQAICDNLDIRVRGRKKK
ncbi:hypothetical protein Tco_1271950 [Tanacetum coccineum]